MTDHPFDHLCLNNFTVPVKAIADRIDRVIQSVEATGVAPVRGTTTTWLAAHVVSGNDDAGAVLWLMLNVVDILAAQTAALVEHGALRAKGAEAGALRRQASILRASRRVIQELRHDITQCPRQAQSGEVQRSRRPDLKAAEVGEEAVACRA